MVQLKGDRVVANLSRPVLVTSPPGDAERLFIIEQQTPQGTGRIRVLHLPTSTLAPEPFLEIDSISTGNEQGLLGLAFHPDYAKNKFLYVNLTDVTGATNIRRYQASSNPNK